MDGTNFPSSSIAIVLPVLACIAIIIDIPPFIWHIKNRNFAAAGLVFWVVLSLFLDFINALIWPTDDVDNWFKGYGLCDVEAKLLVALSVGLPGSLLCIMRNLAKVLDTRNTVLMPTTSQRRRQLAIEFFLTFGFPIILMGVHYIVQPSRYYILAIAGCTPAFDNSWPTVVLVWIWPSFLSIVGVFYSALVIIRVRKYRQDFSSIINSSSSNLNKSRFKRLFFMSSFLILVCLPVQLYVLHENSLLPLIPYSWDAVHGPEWSEIVMVPSAGTVYYDHWIHIAVGFAVFVFFGLGKDAINMYRNWLLKAGLGAVFPSLHRTSSAAGNLGVSSTRDGTFSSRARLFFSKRLSEGSSLSFRSRTSVSDSLTSPSPNNPHKTFPALSTIIEVEPTTPSDPPSASTDEKPPFAAPPPSRNQMPYLASFISAFRSPAASRQMAACHTGNGV